MKANLIEHEKTTDEFGNTIEVKIWEIPKSKDKPHGYKYSIAYIELGKRIIGYDNAEGKGDHRHYGNKEERYEFKSIEKLFNDFYQDIRRFKNEG